MSTATEEAGIGMLVLLASFVITSIATISSVRSLCFIFSSRDGRLQRTLLILRVSARRVFLSVVAVAMFGFTWSYLKNAHLRSIITPARCDSEHSPDGLYVVRYCLLGGKIVLRLYDRDGKHLLAERTYQNDSKLRVRLYWKKGVLTYAEDNDLGVINLPPSLYDRLLAKFP